MFLFFWFISEAMERSGFSGRNPWADDDERILGSVRNVLLLAERTGHRTQVVNDGNSSHFSKYSSSTVYIWMSREILLYRKSGE